MIFNPPFRNTYREYVFLCERKREREGERGREGGEGEKKERNGE